MRTGNLNLDLIGLVNVLSLACVDKVRDSPWGQLVRVCPGDQSLLSVPGGLLDLWLPWGQVVPAGDNSSWREM